MQGPLQGYWFDCRRCGFLASTLEPSIAEAASPETIEESDREDALGELRRQNFERILDRLAKLRPLAGASLLDVGCAHGWFLQAAERRGVKVLGIEPDPAIAAKAAAGGQTVLRGLFPAVLPADVAFDLIAFNDVFEHLPDPHEATRACLRHLKPGGLLVLNLPSSHGALFRLARLLSHLGLRGPLDRLWQKNFPSPHLTYFHPEGLARFMHGHGLREVHRSRLPTLSRKGLWKRIRYDLESSLPAAVIYFALLSVLAPMLSLLPADISFQVFERAPEP